MAKVERVPVNLKYLELDRESTPVLFTTVKGARKAERIQKAFAPFLATTVGTEFFAYLGLLQGDYQSAEIFGAVGIITLVSALGANIWSKRTLDRTRSLIHQVEVLTELPDDDRYGRIYDPKKVARKKNRLTRKEKKMLIKPFPN